MLLGFYVAGGLVVLGNLFRGESQPSRIGWETFVKALGLLL